MNVLWEKINFYRFNYVKLYLLETGSPSRIALEMAERTDWARCYCWITHTYTHTHTRTRARSSELLMFLTTKAISYTFFLSLKGASVMFELLTQYEQWNFHLPVASLCWLSVSTREVWPKYEPDQSGKYSFL